MAKLGWLMDSRFILLVFLVLAFVYPKYSLFLSPLVIYTLFITLTLSLKDIESFRPKDVKWGAVIKLSLLNLFLMSALYIICAKLFIHDPAYSNAIIAYGLMPPAVSVLSFSYLFFANTQLAVVAEIASYLATIVLLPLGAFLFFGSGFDQSKLWEVIIIVIILPLIFSRVVNFIEKKTKKIPYNFTKLIILLSMGITTYVTIGLSKQYILKDPLGLLPVIFYLIFAHFIVGIAIYFFVRKKTRKPDTILYVLFGTLKNSNAAIPMSLAMFGPSSMVVFALSSLVFPAYYLFFEWFFSSKVGLKKSKLPTNFK